jgi:Hsp20/alpha crystallin family protein
MAANHVAWAGPVSRRFAKEVALQLPAVDVYDKGDAVVVKAEIPGISKDELEVTLTDAPLTIKGEKKKEALANPWAGLKKNSCFSRPRSSRFSARTGKQLLGTEPRQSSHFWEARRRTTRHDAHCPLPADDGTPPAVHSIRRSGASERRCV